MMINQYDDNDNDKEISTILLMIIRIGDEYDHDNDAYDDNNQCSQSYTSIIIIKYIHSYISIITTTTTYR